jgi:hypothetical protein
VPEEWEQTTLDEVCEIQKGRFPLQKTAAGIFPLIGTASSWRSAAEFDFEGPTVFIPLVSSTGHGHASIKRLHYADEQVAAANIMAGATVKDTSQLDGRFLFLYLSFFKDQLLVSRMQGTANVSLKVADLAGVPVSLPPFAEQLRIADLMSALDDQLGAYDAQIWAGNRRRSALLHELLKPQEGWERTTLGVVAKFFGGYGFGKKFQGVADGEVAFFKVSDMNAPQNKRRMRVASNWVSLETLGKMRAKARPAGTVIFPKVGAALKTEKRRILAFDACFDNNIMGLLAKREVLIPEFLFLFMETVRLGELSQEGAVPSVNNQIVGSIAIAIPPLPEQLRITDLMGAVDDELDALREARDQAKTLRTALLQDLLSGAHRIPESYDRLLKKQAAPSGAEAAQGQEAAEAAA